MGVCHRIGDGHTDIEKVSSRIEESKPWEKLSIAPSDLNKFIRATATIDQVSSRYSQGSEREILDLDCAYLEGVNQDKDYSYCLVMVEKSQEKDLADLSKGLGSSSVDLKTRSLVRDIIRRNQALTEEEE